MVAVTKQIKIHAAATAQQSEISRTKQDNKYEADR
jgi:hypothetical protein